MTLNSKHTSRFRLYKIEFLVFLGLFNLAVVQCVQVPPAATVSKPNIAFKLRASSGKETVATTNIEVKLSNPSSQTVAVSYTLTNSTASNTNRGSGKDYTLTNGTLIFQPGTITKSISISIVNDSINEADETINIKLSNPHNAVLGAKTLHTYTIIDSDRQVIVDVKRDFGAAGNGITDDTSAIQRAINATYNSGGGVILFPPGVYIVKSVNLRENITYQGYGATIKRPPMQGKWTRTFTTEHLYSGNVNSTKPLIIKGLTFDGNSQKQGAYQKYQLEQAHLVFLAANPNSPKRLKAVVEDCKFKNGVADGISIYTNVDIKVYNCEAIDVFRGGFVLTGGYSSAEVYQLTTRGKIHDTGIDIEVDGKGYSSTYKVDVKLEKLNLIDGDFDVDVQDGSMVIGNNIIANAPFRIFSQESTMKFTNSKFKVGAADGFTNIILLPHKVTFENCEFYVTRKENGDPYKYFGLDVLWQSRYYKTQPNQSLVFNNCSFYVDKNIKSTDTTYAIYSSEDARQNNSILKINGGSISNKFDFGVFRQQVR